MVNKGFQYYNEMKFFPIFITMLLGMVNIINISETIKIVVGIVFLVVLLLLSPVESAKYLMFILSANELLNIGTTSLTMMFVALFTIKECFFVVRKLKININIVACFLALVVVGVLAYILIGTNDSLIYTIKHIFFLYYTAKVLKESRNDWKKVYINTFQYIAFGTIYFAVLSVVINGIPSIAIRFTPSSEITINFFAIICALAIVNLLYGIMLIKASKKNWWLIIGCVICGLLTHSRSFILAVLIGFLLLFLLTSSFKKIVILFTGILGLFAVVVLYMAFPTSAELIDIVMLRITDPTGGDISNGRYQLWEYTITAMKNSFVYILFGAGNYNQISASFDNKIRDAHNLFLETWVVYGMFGCLFLILIYILYFKQYLFAYKQEKIKSVCFVPLIVMICCLFFSHHFIGRSMSIVFAFSFLPIVMGVSNKNGECL